jgi:hypothetical protein
MPVILGSQFVIPSSQFVILGLWFVILGLSQNPRGCPQVRQ